MNECIKVWIKVKDRLPEKMESVLVYWNDGVYTIFDEDDNYEVFKTGVSTNNKILKPTHWMPLPKPPGVRSIENNKPSPYHNDGLLPGNKGGRMPGYGSDDPIRAEST